MLEKDATWVAIGFVMFLLLLVYFKVPGQITKILDSRAQKINDELEEAKKLREEAQTVLAEFQKKNKEEIQTRWDKEKETDKEIKFLTVASILWKDLGTEEQEKYKIEAKNM